ncbi:MAG: hypothetical protein Q8S27_02145, partial [Hoeflea sp.]|nr:hypothetical protein [Hoeflea sp.]
MSQAAELSCVCGKNGHCVIYNRAICSAGTQEDLQQLSRISHLRSYPRGSVIQAQGEPCDIVGNI